MAKYIDAEKAINYAKEHFTDLDRFLEFLREHKDDLGRCKTCMWCESEWCNVLDSYVASDAFCSEYDRRDE